jgi:hypothetical protein
MTSLFRAQQGISVRSNHTKTLQTPTLLVPSVRLELLIPGRAQGQLVIASIVLKASSAQLLVWLTTILISRPALLDITAQVQILQRAHWIAPSELIAKRALRSQSIAQLAPPKIYQIRDFQLTVSPAHSITTAPLKV